MAGKIIADTLEHSTAGSVDSQYVVKGVCVGYGAVTGASVISNNISLNVSSVTDSATGKRILNLTNALDKNNYPATTGNYASDSDRTTQGGMTDTTNKIYIYSLVGGTFSDYLVNGQVTGDLA